jgi:hypothetical protein
MRIFDYQYLQNNKFDMDILTLVARIHECKGRQELYIKQKPAALS